MAKRLVSTSGFRKFGFTFMQLNPSPAEHVTAATNLPLCVAALVAATFQARQGRTTPLRAGVWAAMFASLALASGLGVVAHGLALGTSVQGRIWCFINAALALSVACFAAGATLDGWGETVARRLLPFLLAVGASFFYYANFCANSFLPFIIYEGVAMLFALAVYATLTTQGRLPGAAWIAAGVSLTILAAVLQATRWITFTIFLPFDHNGVFHLVQLPGLLCLFVGVEKGNASPGREPIS